MTQQKKLYHDYEKWDLDQSFLEFYMSIRYT